VTESSPKVMYRGGAGAGRKKSDAASPGGDDALHTRHRTIGRVPRHYVPYRRSRQSHMAQERIQLLVEITHIRLSSNTAFVMMIYGLIVFGSNLIHGGMF